MRRTIAQQLVDHAAAPGRARARRASAGAGGSSARGHRQHLLLAAAHGAGQLRGALGELRESGEAPARGARRARRAATQPGAELEVLAHASSAGTAAGLRAPARAPRARWPLASLGAAARRRAAPRPARGISPASALSSVVLPAPLGPTIDGEARRRTSRSRPRARGCRRSRRARPRDRAAVGAHAVRCHLVAQIGLDHARHRAPRRPARRRRSCGPGAARPRARRSASARAPHARSRPRRVPARRAGARMQPRHRFDLGLGQPRRHFVEQQHARPRRRAPCRSRAGAAAKA